ncbi:MAG: transcription antitermination factor NusB [Akkermansiaceae bacterium]|nr:transcription antitermination factor NusB [Akkermansiaceae bacterium]
MAILKRRNIREAAIQFLYLADLENGPEAAEMEQAFWQMIQESSLNKLNLAKSKAILHVAQGRDSRTLKFEQLASAIQPELKASPEAQTLYASLKQLLAQENKLSEQIDTLQSIIQNKSTNPIPDHAIQDVIEANQDLMLARSTWSVKSSDHSDWNVKLEALNATIAHLTRSSQRLASIEDPESTIVDFAHLRASSAELSTFRRETQELVSQILEHKEKIDADLARVIENYAPERVDPVDRAILRLASYELQMSDDIPRAVTINEAIEIAKKFGTSDSPRFINGILDAL